MEVDSLHTFKRTKKPTSIKTMFLVCLYKRKLSLRLNRKLNRFLDLGFNGSNHI